ncbi:MULTISPECIES: DUF1178 family protein [Alphaproteobacteria]|uniref:DUF1178 domain-containing protein n=2 Tax=Alphaproteobacteria TaxID=28211 RepID=A0A512HLN0_9HYPH|nr:MULTISPECIES: DUF1178 family protein [Alphaproteobacteria]GEO86355.1 hypothetical protein RNA01_32870 [Ciceribacter naphthalenivorans]GLR21837.1 hypothetical protein GCM10007920_16240 [Ciceribacter naphthalenivorans]GLT04693.1 hypothetical protein GCM10007926_16240 [Sphingomonas psychrolutea]
MIRYSLSCEKGHDFEGWFSESADFDRQLAGGLLTCPVCGSLQVTKVLMAPSVSTARGKEAVHALAVSEAQKVAVATLKQAVASIRANSEDVGERFPEEARKIHYGETEARGIIGEASLAEVKALVDEGIEIAPLPVLPDDVN